MMRWVAFLALACAGTAQAQSWGQVHGVVRDHATGSTMTGVSVVVDGTNFGTATDGLGAFALQLPEGLYRLRFSFVGYRSVVDSVEVSRRAAVSLNVILTADPIEAEEVIIEDSSVIDAGVQRITPTQVLNMPSPFKGYQALLMLPGVSASNELSNQYSVRGGGFNENLIFLNGFEIHMPLRPRQGEQEGLGLFNPELARRITLYTGGFPARYGGKISSSLDIEYGGSEALTGSASVSLLDASVSASATTGSLAWQMGLRKARARRFFETQELKGNYQPDYEDLQLRLAYGLPRGLEVELIGLWARHTFELDPRGRRSFFGTVSAAGAPIDLQSVWIAYSDQSQESDGYWTGLAGLRITKQLRSGLAVFHDISHYRTREHESFLIAGDAIIYDVVADENAELAMVPRGMARQEDRADNEIFVATLTGQGRYAYLRQKHAVELGWSVRSFAFEDALDEQSIVSGISPDGSLVRLVVDSLQGQARLSARQFSAHAEEVYSPSSRMSLTAGIRTSHFSLNREWTFSPRVSVRFEASELLTLTGAWGIYYQQPTYRELRGTPNASTPLRINSGLRSQRSAQVVAGAELFIARRRLYLRGEAYWKRLAQVITYSLDNVRINYSGLNDAHGHAYGFDLQARGEFVPGMESWINYSFLVARERFDTSHVTPYNGGLLARPTDQRHTVALFVQDYIPMDPTWRLHLRAMFGSGLPYTPPIPGKRVGSVVTQVRGPRHSARYPEFRRLDFGATKSLDLVAGAHPLKLEATAELLNVFDITNTVSYSWIPDATGVWQRVPTRLTPRTLNLRLRVQF